MGFRCKLTIGLILLVLGVSLSVVAQTPQTEPNAVATVQPNKPEVVKDQATAAGQQRSREQVLALIEKASKTKPDWWNSVQLNYPETLDLRFPSPANRPWDPKKNVGQYMWGVINENANRFHDGTKFMHYVYSLNKDDPDATQRAMQQLGHCYHDLLQDWARAAYWLRKANGPQVKLANAYWQLGNKSMAVEILRTIKSDYSNHGAAIKLWSDMGELDTALKLAEQSKDPRQHGGRYRAAGDALQRHGQFDQALVYYQKVLDTGNRFLPSFMNKNEALKLNRNHAKAAIESIRIFQLFDVDRLRDGTYTDSAMGYSGPIHVSTTVNNRRIDSVEVTQHKEQQYYSSLTDMPAKIINQQDIRDIDATTGATVTADAIRIATAKALQQARH